VCVSQRKGGGGDGGGVLESDPFSKSLLLFPSRLCFKTGMLLAFEKYPFPYLLRRGPSRHHLASFPPSYWSAGK